MPEISRFLGIVIYMYFEDHAPPHFHAKYENFEIIVTIKDGIIKGEFPKGALRHVLKWYESHKKALLQNWSLAKQSKALKKIKPLR